LQLSEGRYELHVTDVNGAVRSAQFDIVSNPPAIDQTAFASEPDDVRLALAAMQLAKADGGHWRLEAYQRLNAAAASQYAARLLADRLADGKPLDK
jgi:hypothetical protein